MPLGDSNILCIASAGLDIGFQQGGLFNALEFKQ